MEAFSRKEREHWRRKEPRLKEEKTNCVATIESVETGWSFLKGLGAPEEISLAGPNPIPVDFDLGDFLTRTLDILGVINKWCEQCGGRFTAICPDCTAGVCWFCARHKGCLCCEICELETVLSGDWVDGTRLVDDNLSLDFHDMGSFLISEVRGVRLAERPRSDAPHDHLEFRGIVRGWRSLRSDRNGSPTCWRTRDDDGNVATRTCLKDYGRREMSVPCFSQPGGGLGH